jgi:GntR family transcriptional regulator
VNDLHRNFGITAMIRAAGYQPSTTGQQIRTVPAQREAADRLGLAPGEEVTWLRRIRHADKRPVVLSDEIFPARVLTPAELGGLDDTGQSLYAFLYKARGISVYRGLAELTPVKAAADIAAGLQVARGSLLLCISQVDYDDVGGAVMYSVEYHLPDWVRFTIERVGPGRAVDD